MNITASSSMFISSLKSFEFSSFFSIHKYIFAKQYKEKAINMDTKTYQLKWLKKDMKNIVLRQQESKERKTWSLMFAFGEKVLG